MATGRPSTVYLWELAWILPSIALPVGMLAALEAIAGQLYIGITVARLVALSLVDYKSS